MVEGVSHSGFEKRRLQSTTPHLRNRRRTGEEGNSLMDAERASGAGLAIHLGEETETAFPS